MTTVIEVEPAQIPLPRDSMVTVRLSDVQIHPEVLYDEPEMEPKSDQHFPASESAPSTRYSSSRSSRRSSSSSATNSVNWEGLEKTEEQEPRDEGTDNSTALLLARLEQENNALAHDPKSGIVVVRSRNDARPPSIHYLKKLVNGPQRQSLRYSQLPAPPMTELEFWAALVKDYPQTCQRLPTLTSNKIRGGVPPPLRGVVWPAIAGAHDTHLHSEYQRLSNELSPYDGLIGKDVGRSFPNVDMFREKGGEGQQMLGRVLKAFSLYDDVIGYCQGLGLIVGPLLMHMSEPEAFSVLVRLMEHYDLRSCYTPDLAGLHLRIYQFQILLSRHCPMLSAHLDELKIEPVYVSQWFLSFFAVTCPLPMLLRIYDVILSEGATETLMRVALSLMQRNEQKLLAFTEFEDVMQFLLSRALWDTYAQHADDMVTDFVSLTGLVSRESLQNLEYDFKQSQAVSTTTTLKSAASSLLGRFWAGSAHSPSKSATLMVAIPSNPNSSSLKKTSSGFSLTPTVNSTESSASDASTSATEVSGGSRVKSDTTSFISVEVPNSVSGASDRDLHSQIEELLMALNKLQHQQIELARDLQREREERAEEKEIASSLLAHLQKQQNLSHKSPNDEKDAESADGLEELLVKAESQFSQHSIKRTSILVSKHQLRDDAMAWKEKYDSETGRCKDLMKQLDEREMEHAALKEHLKEARARCQDSHREKQRLEQSLRDVKARHSSVPDSPGDIYTPVSEIGELKLPPVKGLREFRLGKQETPRSPTTSTFAKRTSSLNISSIIASEAPQPASADSLLIELVNAKTAEAVARQELEETKLKLDALRKIISGPVSTPAIKPAVTADGTASSSTATTPGKETPKAEADTASRLTSAHAPSSSIGGFFSSWGKRAT